MEGTLWTGGLVEGKEGKGSRDGGREREQRLSCGKIDAPAHLKT